VDNCAASAVIATKMRTSDKEKMNKQGITRFGDDAS